MNRNFFIYFLLIVSLFISFDTNERGYDLPTTGYWAMAGKLCTHPFTDELDSLSGQEIFEMQDENGLTKWFGRYIFKDVCITGICRMVKLWMFWDGAGNYLDIQMPEGEHLTKSDHTEFDSADYNKLHEILVDKNSILGELAYDELTLPPIKDPFQVDGYTSATRPGVKEVVVKDAVYTCHTLWHTVYGSTQDKITDILNERTDSSYLSLMLQSKEPANLIWVIEQVEKESEYHEEFYPQILVLLKSNNDSIYQQAAQYFRADKLADPQLQKEMVKLIPDVDPQRKNDIIWKLIDFGMVEAEVVQSLLKQFINKEIGLGSLNLIYQLILPEHLENEEIKSTIHQLLKHEDAYVQNLTYRLLKKNY